MIGEITRQELLEMLTRGDNLVLLDVLPPAYFRHSHLHGALNVPVEEIASRIMQIAPDKSAAIVVYCQNSSCPVAQKAAHILLDLGYQNVREYGGGKDDWRTASLPLEGQSRRLRKV